MKTIIRTVTNSLATAKNMSLSTLRLHVEVADSGTWFSHYRARGSPSPFSSLFWEFIEGQVHLLLQVHEEEPEWLRTYVSSMSNGYHVLGVVMVNIPGEPISFWDVVNGGRGEFMVSRTTLDD